MSRPDYTITWYRAYKDFVEGPNNANPFAAIAGHAPDQPWCATFRTAGHKSTGVAIPAGGGTASSMTNYYAYKRAGQLLDLSKDVPQMGDIFWLGAKSKVTAANPLGIDHEGSVWQHTSGTRFTSEEGNWGNKCASVTRDWTARGTSWVVGFARPKWDWATPTMLHLPADKTSYTQVVTAVPAAMTLSPSQSAAIYAATPGTLAVDGELGPKTITRWQQLLGVPADGAIGPVTTRAIQARLNKALGARLAVDGQMGSATIRALQAYLGTPQDGKISKPVSVLVKALQRRLNTGAF